MHTLECGSARGGALHGARSPAVKKKDGPRRFATLPRSHNAGHILYASPRCAFTQPQDYEMFSCNKQKMRIWKTCGVARDPFYGRAFFCQEDFCVL